MNKKELLMAKKTYYANKQKFDLKVRTCATKQQTLHSAVVSDIIN